MLPSELDDYSKRFAKHFLSRYPEFEPYMQIDLPEGATLDALEIIIPSPNLSSKESALYIATHGDEITVVFDGWHTHYSNYGSDSLEDEFIGAIELLEDILNERTVVISCWQDNQLCISYASEANSKPSIQSLQDSLKVALTVNRFVVKSWKGTFDAEYKL